MATLNAWPETWHDCIMSYSSSYRFQFNWLAITYTYIYTGNPSDMDRVWEIIQGITKRKKRSPINWIFLQWIAFRLFYFPTLAPFYYNTKVSFLHSMPKPMLQPTLPIFSSSFFFLLLSFYFVIHLFLLLSACRCAAMLIPDIQCSHMAIMFETW